MLLCRRPPETGLKRDRRIVPACSEFSPNGRTMSVGKGMISCDDEAKQLRTRRGYCNLKECMYELQEDRSRRTAVAAAAFLTQERNPVDEAIRASKHEERQAVARAARQNADLPGHFNSASEKTRRRKEHGLHNYAQHMTMICSRAPPSRYRSSSSSGFRCNTNSLACNSI